MLKDLGCSDEALVKYRECLQASLASLGPERLETATVIVDDDVYLQLARFIPAIEVGHRLWVSVNANSSGQVTHAWVHSSPGGLEDIDESEPLDPRSAVRIVHEVPGFASERLAHLSISATDELFPPVAAARKVRFATDGGGGGGDDGGGDGSGEASSSSHAPPEPSPWSTRKALPYQSVHDTAVLTALEDFVAGAAFSAPVRAFAA